MQKLNLNNTSISARRRGCIKLPVTNILHNKYVHHGFPTPFIWEKYMFYVFDIVRHRFIICFVIYLFVLHIFIIILIRSVLFFCLYLVYSLEFLCILFNTTIKEHIFVV